MSKINWAAVDTLFRCCPPAPLERMNCHSISCSAMCTELDIFIILKLSEYVSDDIIAFFMFLCAQEWKGERQCEIEFG